MSGPGEGQLGVPGEAGPGEGQEESAPLGVAVAEILPSTADEVRARPHVEPIHFAVIEFTAPLPLTLRVSDRYLPRSGAFAECLALVQSFGTIEETVSPIDGSASPATLEGFTLFNDAPVAGRDRLSDLMLSPYNPLGYEFAFAKVSIYRYDADLGPGAAERLGVFYLEDPTEIGERLLTLRASDITLVMENALALPRITRAALPECDGGVEGQLLPAPIGRSSVQLKPIVAGRVAVLDGAIDDVVTTITLEDASVLPASGTVLIDQELITYASRTDAQLLNCTRPAQSTDAGDHADETNVFEVRDVYRYGLFAGRKSGGYRVGSLTNIKVNGNPARTAPAVRLADTDLLPRVLVATVDFTPSDVRAFHLLPIGGPLTIAVTTLTSPTVNDNENFDVVRTITIPSDAEVRAATRSMQISVSFSGSFTGSYSWGVYRRITGGAYVLIGGGTSDIHVTPRTLSDTRTYESASAEQIKLHVQSNGTATFTISVTFTDYTVTGEGSAGGGDTSTAAHVIGEVTADVAGIQDDEVGSITGVPRSLLEIPADVTAWLLTLYPGVSLADRGAHWAATRALQASAGLRWAFLLGAEGTERFSDLRRLIGLQSRSHLMTVAGILDLRFIPSSPVIDYELDYRRDVWEQQPAVALRTSRTQIFNRLAVKAAFDYGVTGEYLYNAIAEDLTQPGLTDPIETDLELPWVPDPVVAAALGAFWLGRWKRLRFQIDAVGWQNLLAVEKGDHLAVENHPVLAAHGGAVLPFRVTSKRYDLASENPARIRLTAIEASA